MMKTRELLLPCSCRHLDHVIAFYADLESREVFLSIRINLHDSFLVRLRRGLGFIFGKSRPGWDEDGEVDEVILDEAALKDLWALLSQVLANPMTTNNTLTSQEELDRLYEEKKP